MKESAERAIERVGQPLPYFPGDIPRGNNRNASAASFRLAAGKARVSCNPATILKLVISTSEYSDSLLCAFTDLIGRMHKDCETLALDFRKLKDMVAGKDYFYWHDGCCFRELELKGIKGSRA
jgi:hypothetical protein